MGEARTVLLSSTQDERSLSICRAVAVQLCQRCGLALQLPWSGTGSGIDVPYWRRGGLQLRLPAPLPEAVPLPDHGMARGWRQSHGITGGLLRGPMREQVRGRRRWRPVRPGPGDGTMPVCMALPADGPGQSHPAARSPDMGGSLSSLLQRALHGIAQRAPGLLGRVFWIHTPIGESTHSTSRSIALHQPMRRDAVGERAANNVAV